MTRDELLDMLTIAAQIGRNDESVARAQTRGDITEVIQRRMGGWIDAVTATYPQRIETEQ